MRRSTPARAEDGPTGEGGATADEYYVQVRYPQSRRWVSLAVKETRAAAAERAGNLFHAARNREGVDPKQVRIVSATQIMREGGDEAIRRARAEVEQAK